MNSKTIDCAVGFHVLCPKNDRTITDKIQQKLAQQGSSDLERKNCTCSCHSEKAKAQITST